MKSDDEETQETVTYAGGALSSPQFRSAKKDGRFTAVLVNGKDVTNQLKRWEMLTLPEVVKISYCRGTEDDKR